ncbi:MAG: hypothetical protein LBT04_08735 [Prevotellaceae bacterium]|jgi:hypothetical protein|nr:hypothetical protein [Prevotellaceae bacterium]
MFEKVEVDKSFIRHLQQLVIEFDNLNKDYRDEQNKPKSQINTEEQHKANLLIFRGESQAYWYAADKLRNIMMFFSIDKL